MINFYKPRQLRCFGGGDSGASTAQYFQLAQQQTQNRAMKQLNKVFEGYDDKFFDKVAQDTIKAGEPQLMQDYGKTKNALNFNLANRGLFKSSAGSRLGDLLSRELTTQQQNLANQGLANEYGMRQKVAGMKDVLGNAIIASAAPQETLTGGLKSAAAFTAPTPQITLPGNYSGGNIFGNWAQQYLQSNLAATSPNITPVLSPAGTGGTGALPAFNF